MKLEKILDRLNSLEKGSFIKTINALMAAHKKSDDFDDALSGADRNLKNADSIQMVKVFNVVSDEYSSFIRSEYSKVSSQLDILLDIILRDGNCIMKMDWFAKIYESEIKHKKQLIDEFKKNVTSEKPTIEASRIRDYLIYKDCLYTAYHNDEESNFDPKITADEQSILDVLGNRLELSQDEISMIKYAVLGIPKMSIEDVVADLKDKGIVFLSKKTNTIYVADEIVSALRPLRGKEVADKFYRRVLLQLKESLINTLCRKHGIDIKLSLPEKIEAIIASGISLSSVLRDELYKPEVKINDRKKFITELCDEKLLITPHIKGASLDDKINNLITYFNELYKDEKLGISSNGYEKMLIDINAQIPDTNNIIKSTFQIQDEQVLRSDFLMEYNIMPRDVLELIPSEKLQTFCNNLGIKTRGGVIDNILDSYKDSDSLYIENYESIGNRDLNALKSNGIFIKEAELGSKFEEVTKYILGKLGFVVDEKLRKKLNTEKDKMDILIRIDEKTVVLVECKTVKDNGYNKFSSISRQVKAYKNLLEKNDFTVAKILIVAPDFSEDFVSDCSDDFDLNISLLKASSLVAIYNASIESPNRQVTINMLMKDVLVQEDRIIRALKK